MDNGLGDRAQVKEERQGDRARAIQDPEMVPRTMLLCPPPCSVRYLLPGLGGCRPAVPQHTAATQSTQWGSARNYIGDAESSDSKHKALLSDKSLYQVRQQPGPCGFAQAPLGICASEAPTNLVPLAAVGRRGRGAFIITTGCCMHILCEMGQPFRSPYFCSPYVTKLIM